MRHDAGTPSLGEFHIFTENPLSLYPTGFCSVSASVLWYRHEIGLHYCTVVMPYFYTNTTLPETIDSAERNFTAKLLYTADGSDKSPHHGIVKTLREDPFQPELSPVWIKAPGVSSRVRTLRLRTRGGVASSWMARMGLYSRMRVKIAAASGIRTAWRINPVTIRR